MEGSFESTTFAVRGRIRPSSLVEMWFASLLMIIRFELRSQLEVVISMCSLYVSQPGHASACSYSYPHGGWLIPEPTLLGWEWIHHGCICGTAGAVQRAILRICMVMHVVFHHVPSI